MYKVLLGMILILMVLNRHGMTDDKKSDKGFKNVHLFTKLSDAELTRTMNFMRASLGVHCDYCHFVGKDGWDFGSDAKATKIKARQVISMVTEINKSNFKEEPLVSCFTCHQGRIRPNGTPPLPQSTPLYPTPIHAPQIAEMDASQILDRYAQATGGAAGAATRNARSIVMKGTTDETWKRKVVPYEVYYKAPDKWLLKKTLEDGVSMYVLNGAEGWAQEGSETRIMAERELAMVRDTIHSLQLLPELPSFKPVAVTKRTINDRSAISLEYKHSNDVSEFFYFDAETHLLLGRKRYTLSPVGSIPEQIHYENYKELNGARIPYTLRSEYVDPWIGGIRNFTEILLNVPVEDAQFQMPSDRR
ncbi:photosynthetic reaction center cytochrome c subunit [bacterium]|nr:photosynthetic reaction center cytochrome c subunit [bacterium]